MNEVNKKIIDSYKYTNLDNAFFERIISQNQKRLSSLIEASYILTLKNIIEREIVKEIKKGNIDLQIAVLDKYSVLKTIIRKNKKYFCDDETIDKVYEDAVELLNYRYFNENISMNIINNMKFIFNNNFPTMEELINLTLEENNNNIEIPKEENVNVKKKKLKRNK